VKTSAAEQHFAVRPDGTRLPSRTNPEPGQLRRPTQAPRGFRASAGEEWKCSPLERAPPRDGMECLDQGRSERRHDEIRDRPSPKWNLALTKVQTGDTQLGSPRTSVSVVPRKEVAHVLQPLVSQLANSVHFGDWKSVPVAEGLVAFVLTAEGATASAGRLRRRVSRQVKSVRFCKRRPTYSRSLVQCATSELTEARTSLLVSRKPSHLTGPVVADQASAPSRRLARAAVRGWVLRRRRSGSGRPAQPVEADAQIHAIAKAG
jgi:hypothetical protein